MDFNDQINKMRLSLYLTEIL